MPQQDERRQTAVGNDYQMDMSTCRNQQNCIVENQQQIVENVYHVDISENNEERQRLELQQSIQQVSIMTYRDEHNTDRDITMCKCQQNTAESCTTNADLQNSTEERQIMMNLLHTTEECQLAVLIENDYQTNTAVYSHQQNNATHQNMSAQIEVKYVK